MDIGAGDHWGHMPPTFQRLKLSVPFHVAWLPSLKTLKMQKEIEKHMFPAILEDLKPWPNAMNDSTNNANISCSANVHRIWPSFSIVNSMLSNVVRKLFDEDRNISQTFSCSANVRHVWPPRTNEIFQCTHAYIRNCTAKICLVIRGFLNLNRSKTD